MQGDNVLYIILYTSLIFKENAAPLHMVVGKELTNGGSLFACYVTAAARIHLKSSYGCWDLTQLVCD